LREEETGIGELLLLPKRKTILRRGGDGRIRRGRRENLRGGEGLGRGKTRRSGRRGLLHGKSATN